MNVSYMEEARGPRGTKGLEMSGWCPDRTSSGRRKANRTYIVPTRANHSKSGHKPQLQVKWFASTSMLKVL